MDGVNGEPVPMDDGLPVSGLLPYQVSVPPALAVGEKEAISPGQMVTAEGVTEGAVGETSAVTVTMLDWGQEPLVVYCTE